MGDDQTKAGSEKARPLFVYNGGFLTQTRVRRILALSGWDVRLGNPGEDDWVGVWGKSPTSPRGEFVANKTGSRILRVEDSFLRSVLPGRSGQPPIGLNLDESGVHFDSGKPSDLETLLATHPLDNTALLNRARDAIAYMQAHHLSKYTGFDPAAKLPAAPYVLVIDQTQGDASIEHGGANAATFLEMLVFAQTEHPGNRVVIKSHPESQTDGRPGHFSAKDESDRIHIVTDAVSPWALMEGATAVYTVSSQLGFEAIFAGHKPRVFGQPFYSGWGLTNDENPVARRERKLTRAQLFAAAMILYPKWFDPNRDQLCDLENALHAHAAHTREWREDGSGYVAIGMRAWKRPHMQAFFGATKPLQFAGDDEAAEIAKNETRSLMVWGAGDCQDNVVRVEDGFLRSRGLGAKLTPPLSLIRDDLGIYYDPSRESRLEQLVAASIDLPDSAIVRAERLIRSITDAGLSKYNVGKALDIDLPPGHRILVPGQVEDDASILLGCGQVKSNLQLLETTRAQNPDAVLIFKPHPDVEAGLRKGIVRKEDVLKYADVKLEDIGAAAILPHVQAVWTMTSLLGFEALMRKLPVATLGAPFYAGWGLTDDLADIPERRTARPSLAGFVHAALIDYPRYYDPISKQPCPVEVIVERLQSDEIPTPGWFNRNLSKLQGHIARLQRMWR